MITRISDLYLINTKLVKNNNYSWKIRMMVKFENINND